MPNLISPPLIPYPAELTSTDSHFLLHAQTLLLPLSEDGLKAAQWFRDELHRLSGVMLLVVDSEVPPERKNHSAIRLRQENKLKTDSYELHISEHGIDINASGFGGFFYALQTLLQCVPFERSIAPGTWNLPGITIRDQPRFGWRGLMLDSARHFHEVEFVKRFIDLMAMHKLNVLHWHLTDDQGWRIEIERHPALTSVSAWRRQTRTGHEQKAGEHDFDARPHGGFYSKPQLRDLVAYAAGRNVTIVPEIEMPGHCQAVLAAYPELSCTGEPMDVSQRWGIHHEVFCAGSDEVFRFLEDVLDEVMEIFPSPYIHVGGDECSKMRWEACPRCQRRIRAEKLADENELQGWFIRHFDRFLSARGRRLIGWDEIFEGGLAQNAAIMSWRSEQAGIATAQAGHHVVMAPHTNTYLDYYQSEDHNHEPLAIGGYLPLSKVYVYEPIPAVLTPIQAQHVLGAQSQLWTEYMPRPNNVEYMAYPRACALAEVLWTPGELRDFENFLARLKPHLQRLDRLHVNYRPLNL